MALKTFFHGMLFLAVLVIVAACLPARPIEPEPAPTLTPEPVTPTAEIFNPVDPSPTPLESNLPLTCQVTDLNVYVNEEWGYCFAYPKAFTADESRAADGLLTLYGPGLEDAASPVRASLEVAAQVAPPESGLTPLVDAYLTSLGNTPLPIQRETGMLGGKPAETLDPVPGLLSSRVTLVLNENVLITLRFHPSDLELAKLDLEALIQTVTGSFTFLPQAAPHASRRQSISWFEFGKNISLSYDSVLAPWVDARLVPAVPPSDQVIFAALRPAYVQIRFWGFHGGRPSDLPLMQDDRVAQVMVMQTADFPGFGEDSPQGFVNQLQALKDMLGQGVEPGRCARPISGEPAMPFLPWINAKQSFCAQPRIVEFTNGRGIRYLSHYGQDPSPVMDQQVFYTFQGLADDGQLYVAAFFPVETGLFPTEPPACLKCGEPGYDPFVEWAAILSEQLTRLNDQPENQFEPSLSILDDVIRSIQIGP